MSDPDLILELRNAENLREAEARSLCPPPEVKILNPFDEVILGFEEDQPDKP